MKNKLFVSSLLISTFLNAMDMPPMPPMIPSLDIKESHPNTIIKNKKDSKKSIMPKSCELIPPMVIFLPPPMEKELTNCKNNMNKPKKVFAEKQLSKLFKKKITITKIEIVEKFNQLYKITYNDGVILTNKSVDAFIKQ